MKYRCIKNFDKFKKDEIVEVEHNSKGYFINGVEISKSDLKENFEKIKLKGFKYAPYSHSKMELWNQCPKKFFYNYIADLDLEKIASPILEKGTLFHAILEHDLKNELNNFNFEEPFEALDKENLEKIVNLALNFISSSKIYKKIKKIDGLRLVEQEFYLGKNLEPVTSVEKSLIRGFIDLLIYDKDNHKCYIYDWKTGGKSKESLIKFPKPKNQLELYSIWAFQIFDDVDEITAGFVYVEHEHIAEYKFKRSELPILKEKFLSNIKNIENDEKFKRKASILCAWCDFKEICLGLDPTKDPKSFKEEEIIIAARKAVRSKNAENVSKKIDKLQEKLKEINERKNKS